MKFKTEAERLQHPLAGKIPSYLWNNLFDKKITKAEISLMETPLESFLNRSYDSHESWLLSKLLSGTYPYVRIKKVYVCILLSNPDIQANQLLQLIDSINLDLRNINKYEITDVYSLVAEMGNLDMLKRIESIVPDLQELVVAKHFEAYVQAARNGHLEILQHLEGSVPDQIHEMVASVDFRVYSIAAANGHLRILQHFEDIAPNCVRDMIEDGTFSAPCSAAKNGDLEMLEHFEGIASEYFRKDIASIYNSAAANGQLKILQHLETVAPDLVEHMITKYDAYASAAINDHLNVLEHIENTLSLDSIQRILQRPFGGFMYIYTEAARNGHLEILQHLESLLPNDMQDIYVNYDFSRAYVYAAEGGHLEILQHMEAFSSPEVVQEWIAKSHYVIFRVAVRDNLTDIIKHSLSFSNCFTYAEMHEREYSEYVHPFITEQLTNLRNQRLELEDANPNAVFDLDNSETAKLCFYLIRNIIRRNERALDDDLRFLLDIPAVKVLAHTAVTPNQENELLRLANNTENGVAAELLLNIPAVRELAEQNNYYQQESRGELDLQALAQDRESSMHALTVGEQQRLEAAIEKYQPMIKTAGVNNIIEELRETLLERYQENPAMFSINNKSTELPTEWEDFQQLNLKNATRDQALKAYYQHKDHTAWRYLSKPNHWMNERASYVYIDEETHERWSTFEDYQPIIAMLYLAAVDKSTPPTEGHTYDGRVDHFIDELAHIGRAHNWDKTRLNAQGQPEEYDDLTGDKPSCYSGVKRRLFQSVVGHPLITMLSEDMVQQELKSFVHEHFKKSINNNNRDTLNAAMDKIIMGNQLEEDNIIELKKLDIHQKEINEFIATLSKKYGKQFNTDPSFKSYILNTLSLTDGVIEESMNSHLSKLYSFANLQILLDDPKHREKAALKEANKVSNEGLFATQKKGDAGSLDTTHDRKPKK